ncbi:helix-turn-helix transcriptional regulator [Enterobacter sp. RHBSTW-00994]|uniref:helix-turn-helix domain-containing protein n=1 Tax=Enterobacteriaceae TaxID=543 RepID=UPI0015E9E807|nr:MULTISPECIES: helix-turn-helix transcriptional regulator [Enterobacteriaceae]MBM3073146.1 LuxR family transcriptional regulator [Lelliottia sp. RWM.1]QLR41712.1 helix-turn-helix transcriptional regulator [Enterobacter sp. RHBSTW-00994]
MPRTTYADYQIIILSDNYFLWLGLKAIVSAMMNPRPDIFWINEVRPENILRIREQVMTSATDLGWLVFTEAFRINDIQVYLPSERVNVLAADLSIAQLSNRLKTADFTDVAEPDATLTRSELRVCMLIGKGLSLARIAQLLKKSPKTIYTHKRNAMSKFHCQNLAQFHRKICLLERQSLML